MKKIALFLLILLSVKSVIAQNTLDKLGLTSANNTTVAYSLRLLSSTYNGPLIRIRIETSFYDVYPDNLSNQFSTTSKISVAYSTYNASATGATSNSLSTVTAGNSAFVAIWYDQSGNGTNLTQSNTINQPRIISSGVIDVENNLPFIRFFGQVVGNRNALDLASAITTNGQVFIINKFIGLDGFLLGNYGDYFWHSNAGTSKLFEGAYTSSSVRNSTIYQNGNLVPSESAIWNTKLAINIVAPQDPSTGTTWNNIGSDRATLHNTTSGGGYSELIVFNTALSNSERLAVQSSQSNYYGICLLAAEPSSNNQSVLLNATATGLNVSSLDPDATYQWYSNTVNSNAGGTILDGETGTTYTPNTSVEGTLCYYAIITTPTQTCTSSVSGYVRVGIEVTVQPSTSNQIIEQDSSVNNLSITATGSAITYQWYKSTTSNNSSGILIDGATASSYTPSTADVGTSYYYAIVTGQNTTITSNVSGYVKVFEHKVIWNGPDITFTKTAGSDPTLSANQDSITNNVRITKENNLSAGLFNIAQETSYDRIISITDTEWSNVPVAKNITSAAIENLTFTYWSRATRFRRDIITLNQYFLVHLITDDVYVFIKILSWNSDGSFSYERSTKPLLQTTVLNNFADQNKQYRDGSYTLIAPTSNNSNAQFTYTSSNTSVATVNGNIVTIMGEGTTTITATQVADASFLSATTTATLTVGSTTVVTKHGENSNTKSTFVNKNGAINSTEGVSKNGEIKETKSGE